MNAPNIFDREACKALLFGRGIKKLIGINKKFDRHQEKTKNIKKNCLVTGPLVLSSSLWTLGPLVPWSVGPLVLWSAGPLVLQSFARWSFGPLVPWSPGPLVLWSFGPLVL